MLRRQHAKMSMPYDRIHYFNVCSKADREQAYSSACSQKNENKKTENKNHWAVDLPYKPSGIAGD